MPPHERAARVIRLVGWITLVLGIGVVAAVLIPAFDTGRPLSPHVWLLSLGMIAVPASLIVVARGIFRHREWARTAGIVYGVLMLTGFPIGTVIGAYVLWQLRKGWPVDSPAYVNPWSGKK